MNFLCCVCLSFFKPTDEIVGTNCGHLFHDKCLVEWTSRTPNCPQCRKATPVSKIHSLFLNFNDANDSINNDDENMRTLQNENEHLLLEISVLQTKYDKLQKQFINKEKLLTNRTNKHKNDTKKLNESWSKKLNNAIVKSQVEHDKLKTKISELEKIINCKDKELKYYQDEYVAMSAQIGELKPHEW